MNRRFFRLISLAVVLLPGCSTLLKQNEYLPCSKDEKRLKLRSKELKAIREADQDDRKGWEGLSREDLQAIVFRDIERRKRVAEIFAEGCFSEGKDFANAALVFQHGDHPDHFYQAYLFSKRAYEMGERSEKRLMALAIDRYLVSKKYRQLFGSQIFRSGTDQENCWCLQPIERGFSEDKRRHYAGRSLKDIEEELKEMNANLPNCTKTLCGTTLADPPKGVFPEIW